jgi:hypothetical protein
MESHPSEGHSDAATVLVACEKPPKQRQTVTGNWHYVTKTTDGPHVPSVPNARDTKEEVWLANVAIYQSMSDHLEDKDERSRR